MTERAEEFLITLAQLNPTVGDVAGNAAKARAARIKARADGADLLVFPELFITGYPAEDLVLKPAFQSACRAAIESLARETADGGPAVLIGSPCVEDGKLYNAFALLDEGRIAALRYKANLPNYGVVDEKRLFARGPAAGPVTGRGVRVGVAPGRVARTSGGKSPPPTKTSSNVSPRPVRKLSSCRTARLTRATRTMCGCRSRLPALPRAGCPWCFLNRSA